MVIIATPPADQSMRRLWRRRRYQRLGSDPGHARSTSFRLGRLSRIRRRASTLQSKIMSPLKLLTKFHDAYVKMMMRVANSVGNMYAIGEFGNGKRIHKPHRTWLLPRTCCFQLESLESFAASKNLLLPRTWLLLF